MRISDWSADVCSSDLINKIDKPGANPDRVKQELLQHELITEDLGGDIMAIEVSALQKTNLDKLEEAILLQAEVLEFTANPHRMAEGVVIEARLERGRGRSEEHTSELQSLMRISYAVFCLKKKRQRDD